MNEDTALRILAALPVLAFGVWFTVDRFSRAFKSPKTEPPKKVKWCGCPEDMGVHFYILNHSRTVVRGADRMPICMLSVCEVQRKFKTEPFERIES